MSDIRTIIYDLAVAKKQLALLERQVEMLERSPELIMLSEYNQSPLCCLIAVKQSGRYLANVPVHLRTPSVCAAAVANFPHALRDVPDTLITADLCLLAVGRSILGADGLLKAVPDCFRTYSLCLTAVSYNAEAFRDVPLDLQTTEMCVAAISRAQYCDVIPYVRKDLLTHDLCFAAVKAYPRSFLDVPLEFKTFELCLAAAKQDRRILDELPDILRQQVLDAL